MGNPLRAIGRLRTVIEDQFLTARNVRFTPDLWNCDSSLVEKCVEELTETGYTRLGRVLDAEQLEDIQNLISLALQKKLDNINVHWNEDSIYWQIMNPLRLSNIILKLAIYPLTMAIAERYFHRKVYLADVDLRRILPANKDEIMAKSGYSSSSWHRDVRGRQLKMMVYLTDVGHKDSCFSFLPNTHDGQYLRNKSYLESRYDEDSEAVINAEKIDWLGLAGEAMLFDTNLIHRLTRKPTAAIRDSITFYYTPGQSLRILDYKEEDILPLNLSTRSPFGQPGRLFRPRT